MRYMLLINLDENAMAGANPDPTKMSPEYAAYTEAMHKAGVLVSGERLQDTRASKRVRTGQGGTEVLDGPFAETKEQLGGFYMIEVPDMQDAIAWAKRCPSAATGSIDVRPVWDYAAS